MNKDESSDYYKSEVRTKLIRKRVYMRNISGDNENYLQ